MEEEVIRLEYKPISQEVLDSIAAVESQPKIKIVEWTPDLETSLEGLLLACRFDLQRAAGLFNEFLAAVHPECQAVAWQDLAKKWKELKYSAVKKPRPKLDAKWQALLEVLSTRSQASGQQQSSVVAFKPSASDRPATLSKSDVPEELGGWSSDVEG